MSDLVKRSIASVGWNIAVSVIQTLVGLVRSLLLARLLPVDTFGTYAFASSIVTLSAIAPNFGMAGAFLHRSEETEEEDQAAAVHLTLKLVSTTVWMALLVAGSLVLAGAKSRLALVVLTLTHGGKLLCQTPNLILIRRVVHRRLALLQSVNIGLSALVAVVLAWRGFDLWALLSTDIITAIVATFFLYVWRPVWRPRLTWSPSGMRYFLRYGSRSVVAEALLRALDRVDDLWTGAYLGDTAMGFYSRAYSFATYPRTLLAQSVNKVSGGAYAEVAGRRKRLSQAFFRTNALLVRSGFLLSGLLALIAPELIRLLLGTKWLPMLTAFRLMLVFTLLDPIKVTVANLFLAVGRPGEVVRARAVQLVVLVIGLVALGTHFGIAGVALAVDIMLVTGISLLLWQARKYADFSAWTLFAGPGAALVLGLALARGAILVPGVLGSPWRTGVVKITAFVTVYGSTLLILERRELPGILSLFKTVLLADNR